MARKIPPLLLGATLAAAVHSAHAIPVTDGERAMLPRWCRATQSLTRTPDEAAEYQRLQKVYGFGWTHMHHYCWALVELMHQERLYPKPFGTSDAYYAIQDMDYVLRNTQPGFIPRSEVLAKKARTQLRYFSAADAANTAQQLIKEFPTFADGYVILADALLHEKKRDEAMKVLEQGSQAVQDKDRFEKLKSLLNLK